MDRVSVRRSGEGAGGEGQNALHAVNTGVANLRATDAMSHQGTSPLDVTGAKMGFGRRHADPIAGLRAGENIPGLSRIRRGVTE